MDSEQRTDARRGELRAQLGAAGSVLGVPVEATDDERWEVVDGTLRVGLGWYAARGHGDAEAVALALLHLWEGPRGERAEAARARRHRSISAMQPHAAPLLDAVLRLQAAAELLRAMPGLRAPLGAALMRSIPADASTLPRHLQWVTAVLWLGTIGAGASAGAAPGVEENTASLRQRTAQLLGSVDPDVAGELTELGSHAASGIDPLRRVLAPDPGRPALQRYERALALLLPPYERLLARDAADRGLDVAGDTSSPADADSGPGLDSGAAAAGSEASEGEQPETSEASPEAAAGEEQEHARPGDGQESAEGADLFAAEHAGFVQTMLETPMAATGSLLDAVLDIAAEPESDHAEGSREPGSGGGGAWQGSGATALAEYRARAAALAPAIERMREVWARVIRERVALTPALSRRPEAEGDELATDALPAAVAQVLAGVARPLAYRNRVARPRRARRAGSTDYVFLIDRSASMQGRIAAAASDGVLVMLEALSGVERDVQHAERLSGSTLDLDVRTALLVFDAEVEIVKPLSSGMDDGVRRTLDAAIRSPRGSTNDGAALRAAAEQLGVTRAGAVAGSALPSDGRERTRMVILVSDGGSNDPVAAARELRALRAAGVRVVGCGFGSDEMIDRYAPDGRRIDDPARLPETLHELVVSEIT